MWNFIARRRRVFVVFESLRAWWIVIECYAVARCWTTQKDNERECDGSSEHWTNVVWLTRNRTKAFARAHCRPQNFWLTSRFSVDGGRERERETTFCVELFFRHFVRLIVRDRNVAVMAIWWAHDFVFLWSSSARCVRASEKDFAMNVRLVVVVGAKFRQYVLFCCAPSPHTSTEYVCASSAFFFSAVRWLRCRTEKWVDDGTVECVRAAR